MKLEGMDVIEFVLLWDGGMSDDHDGGGSRVFEEEGGHKLLYRLE